MHSEYIEERNSGYYVAGTRISLDSVVYAFRRGDSPERILQRYPLLEKPSRIYGVIDFASAADSGLIGLPDRSSSKSQPSRIESWSPMTDGRWADTSATV